MRTSFDIQQGVAIGIFVKKNLRNQDSSRLQFTMLNCAGLRQETEKQQSGRDKITGGKYLALAESDVSSTAWAKLDPQSPFYLYVPYDTTNWAEYEKGWRVDQIFPVNSVGVVTARDKLTIHWNKGEIWQTVKDFSSLPPGRSPREVITWAETSGIGGWDSPKMICARMDPLRTRLRPI